MSRRHDHIQVMVWKFARHAAWVKGATLWLVASLGATNASPSSTEPAPKAPVATIVLDAGHSPLHPGALGARGRYEVSYNDAMTNRVAQALKSAGFNVVLTRTPLQEISLEGRSQVANSASADLFLAIHHDSAQL